VKHVFHPHTAFEADKIRQEVRSVAYQLHLIMTGRRLPKFVISNSKHVTKL